MQPDSATEVPASDKAMNIRQTGCMLVVPVAESITSRDFPRRRIERLSLELDTGSKARHRLSGDRSSCPSFSALDPPAWPHFLY